MSRYPIPALHGGSIEQAARASSPPFGAPLRTHLRAALQVLFFVGVWYATQRLLQWLHWSLPAAVPGLFAVLLLLASGVLPERRLAAGADWLLGEMLLFFIPPLLAVVRYGPLLEQSGWRLLATIMLGSLLVLVGTGLVVERTLRWERARHAARARRAESRP